jgi:hypothetical protein
VIVESPRPLTVNHYPDRVPGTHRFTSLISFSHAKTGPLLKQSEQAAPSIETKLSHKELQRAQEAGDRTAAHTSARNDRARRVLPMTTPRRQKHDEMAMTVPWDVVSSYLSLREVLSLRLASSQVAMVLSDNLGYEQCSDYLHVELMRRNVYVFNDARNWRHARRAPAVHCNDESNNPCLLSWLARASHSSSEEAMTNSSGASGRPASRLDSPFCLLLRCLRVTGHLPRQLVVAFSGKYGRHCWGLSPRNGAPSVVVRHSDCHRRTAGRRCVTCRTQIETVPMTTTQHASADPSESQALPFTIDLTLCIPVGAPKRDRHTSTDQTHGLVPKRVRLDKYHTKCIPNVPSDLVCPCCVVTDRRTLVLTEMSYKTEAGTERISPSTRSLTFTPAAPEVNGEEGARGDKKKRLRLDEEGCESGSESSPELFPPMHGESFFYNLFVDPAMDVKHAISLHCDGCGKFGVLSPADLRVMESTPRFALGQDDASISSVMFSSAFLQRAATR